MFESSYEQRMKYGKKDLVSNFLGSSLVNRDSDSDPAGFDGKKMLLKI